MNDRLVDCPTYLYLDFHVFYDKAKITRQGNLLKTDTPSDNVTNCDMPAPCGTAQSRKEDHLQELPGNIVFQTQKQIQANTLLLKTKTNKHNTPYLLSVVENLSHTSSAISLEELHLKTIIRTFSLKMALGNRQLALLRLDWNKRTIA